MLKKIKIIILYFGEFPNYFGLWEKSALKNKDYEFLIFTDNCGYENSKQNIRYIKMSFSQVQKRFYDVLGENIVLDSPYKLNDYRPTFGRVFNKEIGDTDFWGFADIDVILGNLSQYIIDSDLNYYDKIGNRGHLQFFANTNEMNTLYLKNNRYGLNFEYVSSHKGAFHFDEMWGINGIASTQGIRVKEITNIADISTKKFLFDNDLDILYFYRDGNLFKKNGHKVLKEVSYIHLQKRPMTISFQNMIEIPENYKILPDQFINSSIDISDKLLKRDWPDGQFKHLIKYYNSSFKKGELTARIPLLLKKLGINV